MQLSRHNNFKHYLSLVKFSHTIFAMPFAVIGYFLGLELSPAVFTWELFIGIILCMVFARNAAMAFNRYVDRKIDTENPRTALREIPRGIIKPNGALIFVIINSLLFILTTWFINNLVFLLSPVALIIILGYSLTKKITALCHFILGIGLSLAPIGAYLAVTSTFHPLPLTLSFIVLCWTSGFDIIYALQDEQFDKNQKLRSIPVLTGKKKALLLSTILHIISGILVLAVGTKEIFSMVYWVGAGLFILLLVIQHSLVKPHDLSKINIAFFTTNGIASILYAVFTLVSLYY
jgi:4-hydroxybenzoate polyprenyltransferase